MPRCPNRTLFGKIKLQITVLSPSGISWESIYLNNRLLNYSPSQGIVPSHNNRELNWASSRRVYSSWLLPTHQPAVPITPELFYHELCPIYSRSNTERPAPQSLRNILLWPPPPAQFHSHTHKIKNNFLISNSQVITFPNYLYMFFFVAFWNSFESRSKWGSCIAGSWDASKISFNLWVSPPSCIFLLVEKIGSFVVASPRLNFTTWHV